MEKALRSVAKGGTVLIYNFPIQEISRLFYYKQFI